MQKKLPLINIVIAALLALLAVLSGFLGSVASNNLNNFPIKLPPAIMSLLQSVWPWLLAVTLAYMGLNIWLVVRQSTSGDNAFLSRSQRQQGLIEKQNRRRMLEEDTSDEQCCKQVGSLVQVYCYPLVYIPGLFEGNYHPRDSREKNWETDPCVPDRCQARGITLSRIAL